MQPSVESFSPNLANKSFVAEAKPFLKWAGGKRQLLSEIRRFYPSSFNSYFEPFVGSGAVFFDLHSLGLLNRRKAVLIDTNADLIGCYKIIRDSVEDLIDELKKLERTYRRRRSEHFYHVRDRRFNPARQALFATSRSPSDEYTPELAAMVIYLNRTGFNGLFRLNSSGLFNVPAGRYANPRICDADNLRRVSLALRDHDVVVQRTSFEVVLNLAQSGDFVYFDPPYAPVSSTAHFTAYTADGFSYAHQAKLQSVVIELCERGCHVLLSNSTAPEIAELYDGNKYTADAGLSAHQVAAKRAINSDPAARGTVWEYLVTNIQPSR